MQPKLVRIGDKYYQTCLWSGTMLESRYGIPKRRRDGSVSRSGSFADAACATSWVVANVESPQKQAKMLEDLALDLGVEVSQLMQAPPQLNPLNQNFDYRETVPWMYRPDLHVSLETDLRARKLGSEERKERKRKGSEARRFLLYEFGENGEVRVEPDQLSVGEVKEFVPLPLSLRKLVYLVHKGKDVLLLCEEGGKTDNVHLRTLFGEHAKGLVGNALALTKKPFHDDGAPLPQAKIQKTVPKKRKRTE